MDQSQPDKFYCSEKHDKTNRVDSDWGTNQNITRAQPQNNTKHFEGHSDHEEAQAGDQADRLGGESEEECAVHSVDDLHQ